jgi:protein-tyrosine phosphatase
MTKVLMVCTANICRSPMALAVARHLVATNSTAPNWQFDAAGTHAAKPPQATDVLDLCEKGVRGLLKNHTT